MKNNKPPSDRDPPKPSKPAPTNDSNESIQNCVNQKFAGPQKLQRTKSTPTKSFRVAARRKCVTFADEVGGELTQSVLYTPEVAYFDDFRINYSTEHASLGARSESFSSSFSSSRSIDVKHKYNFENFRNVDNLTNSNVYGLHLNHVALKSLIDSRFCISITVIVHNIHFEKQVNIHYTSDSWCTKHVCECTYLCPINPKFDIFTVKINYKQFNSNPNVFVREGVRFEFAVEYVVNGEHHWDNNNRKNFIIHF
uniref:Phosphatase 1 regulatory subunit 3D n=1 Tax=Salmo salar TaxID=8030 RepID=B5X776_SALSA|nr:phosphatase 1 regulatory subunit 3D [Salmo salar]ACI66696.1 phosphatase 1 regulatory subunit 3D [Salmo salar]